MDIQDTNNKALERIMRVTGRYPVTCTCEHCRKQCQTPCLGTPQDIWRLMEAGYESQLRLTFWAVGMLLGKLPVPIIMVQAYQTPHGCIFWENGLCQLHDSGLKPTEGKLSHHIVTAENLSFENSLSWNVAREWLVIRNFPLVEKIVLRISQRDAYETKR